MLSDNEDGWIMEDRDFGKWLVTNGLLQKDDLRRAMEIHTATHSRLDTVLIDLGLMPEDPLLEALGRFHNTRTVSRVELHSIGPTVAHALSPRIATRLRVAPFRIDGKTLSVATLDPGDLLIEDELSLITGGLVASYVTLEFRLFEALSRLYNLKLPAHYEALIQRADARGATPGGIPVAASKGPQYKDPDSNDIKKEMHIPHKLRRRHTDFTDPLDLSAEDLSLFPSLRGDAEDPAGKGISSPVMPRIEAPPADLTPEERLAATARALQNAEMREDIADAVLGYCAPLFKRRMMLVLRGDTVMGWRGEGEGVDPDQVRRISIPISDPSVFVGLVQGTEFWLGPLPEMPRNQELVRGLGGKPPTECFILPVTMRDKPVCFLYYDNIDDGVGGLPMGEMRRLAAKASLAFQVYLLKSKIRNL